MFLCVQCQKLGVEARVPNCSILEGGQCLMCKEDIELEQKIQELQERRRNLRTKMNANHDPFVLKLPPEVASYIFLFCKGECDSPFGALRANSSTPFLLGAVCRGWRQLARSTPQLWSKLTVVLPNPKDCTRPETLPHLVADWLERSGGLPLTLHVSCYASRDAPPESEGSVSIMNALNQHSGRWHEVTFALPSVYLRRLCGTSPPKNLQNLSISDTVYANAANTSLRFTMNTRPGPIKFTADTIPLKAVDIAWDRLVQLDVRSTSLDGVLQVIRDAPLLEICSLSWMFPPTDVFPTSETIVRHQHLRTLKLLWSQNTVYTKFIDSLELPSLESWRFESEENLITVDAISFLKRSGSGLKTLHILQDQAPTFEDFERFLQAAPHLQCLIVVDKANAFSESLVMDNILERIAIPPSACTAILLPDLQSLKLIGSKLNSWVCIPLIFRWPHRKLLTLVIKMESIEIRDEVSRTLVQLVDEGIDLRIFDSDEDYISRFRRLLSTP